MGLDQDSDSFLSLNGEVVFLYAAADIFAFQKRQDLSSG